MMDLTNDQKNAVVRGEAVPIVVDATECIVVRADVFERVKAVLEDGLMPDQVGRLIEQNMQEYDEGDPLLDSYQNDGLYVPLLEGRRA
jgi:hypothetical protein